METILFDLSNYYPPIPPKPYAEGEVSFFRLNEISSKRSIIFNAFFHQNLDKKCEILVMH
jgi:hypothetical protein